MRMVLLLVVLLTGPAFADDPAPRILILGDSISAAYGIDTGEGWPARLQTRLVERGYPHEVVNASVSGDTTAAGLSRLPGALERHRPEVVIIQLGGNDGLRGLSTRAMHDNLVRMVELAQAADARVLLLGIRLPANYGRAYIDRFIGIFREVAHGHDIAFVPRVLDGVAEDPQLMLDDGIHPNPAGQARILDNVWPALESLIRQASRRPAAVATGPGAGPRGAHGAGCRATACRCG